MNYVLDKLNANDFIEGDVLTSSLIIACHVRGYEASKIYLCDINLIDEYVKKLANKKLAKLINLLIEILNGDGDDDGSQVLSAIEEFRFILTEKYKKYISSGLYRNLLNKINEIEEEYNMNFEERHHFCK